MSSYRYGRRRAVIGLAAMVTGTGASVGWAQAPYPNKPVKIVVPFPPGGSTDIFARLLGQRFADALGQPFVIENRPGAGGNIGALAVAKSAPDGYTLLMGTPGTQSVNVHLYPNLGFDGIADFDPVTMAVKAPSLLLCGTSVPVRTLTELIEYARKNPGMRYAHTSIGGTKHLAGELLKMKANIDIVQVPYRGSAPLLVDLVGGQIPIGFDDVLTSLPHVQAGKLRALAITGNRRWPTLPDIPAVAELGGPFADYDVTAWYGLLAPAGTPPAIIQRLNTIAAATLRDPAVVNDLLSKGVEAVGNPSEEFRAFIKSENVRWGDVIKKSGITL